MVNSDIKEKLQHPRRSLGNRHRTQAEKFLQISNDESNLNWAEQSAKQAVLYDFTNPEKESIMITEHTHSIVDLRARWNSLMRGLIASEQALSATRGD